MQTILNTILTIQTILTILTTNLTTILNILTILNPILTTNLTSEHDDWRSKPVSIKHLESQWSISPCSLTNLTLWTAIGEVVVYREQGVW